MPRKIALSLSLVWFGSARPHSVLRPDVEHCYLKEDGERRLDSTAANDDKIRLKCALHCKLWFNEPALS